MARGFRFSLFSFATAVFNFTFYSVVGVPASIVELRYAPERFSVFSQ